MSQIRYAFEVQSNQYFIQSQCANKYLENNRIKQTVILCDGITSPRQVKPLLTGDVTLYDAGVEKFDGYTPLHYSADIARQREELITWIYSGGVLLTHNSMFRGCEAETIVYLAWRWGAIGGVQTRSGPTRAVSQLCLVTTDSNGIKPEKMKQHFTVVDVKEDQAVSQSGEEEETDTD